MENDREPLVDKDKGNDGERARAPKLEEGERTYLQEVAESFSFKALHNSPREVWLIYLIVVMDAFSYFATSYILVLYLSYDFGYDDQEAGWIYGIYGMIISIYAIMLGCTVDVIGVRATMLIGHALFLVARVFLTYTTSKDTLLIMLYVVLPMGSAFLSPAVTTGLRRYTNDTNRSVAFSLYVMMMNVGGLLAAPLVDLMRTYAAGDPAQDTGDMNEYRYIMMASWVAAAVSLVVVFFVREIDVDASGEVREYKIKRKNTPWRIMYQIFTSSRFWRFMLFIWLLVGVRFVFRHLDATFPKFMVRTYGEDVPFASIIAINPFLVIFLIPAITPMAKYVSLYSMILVGATITACSVLWMLMGRYIVGAILFIVFLSIGEATWAPRLFEYSSMVAPKGKEGTFMACASAPLFVAKLGVGGISGWLLTDYCPDTATPENEQCDYFNLWLLVFLMTISSPILMVLLRPIIAKEGHHLVDENQDSDDDYDPVKDK